MADAEISFAYLAFDKSGRRVKGTLAAPDEAKAFERLRREKLSPIRLKAVANRQTSRASAAVSDRDLAGFLSDLGALLKAGADMRAALAILGARSGAGRLDALARSLSRDISGGEALEAAVSRYLDRDRAFIGALVAAGEAAGDIAAGFQRAAEMMEARIQLRDQLISVLSYPLFVLASTVAALGVILMFVVPSLAPLVEAAGGSAPLSMRILIGASDALQSNEVWLALGGAIAIGGTTLAATLGLLTAPIERLALDGPGRKTAAGLVYGAFAIALGTMLSSGAPMSDALRLSLRAVRSETARARLEPVATAVRQGVSLPTALERVAGFPSSVIRLAAVGEVSGSLGDMLARAGKLEEETAIRRIEAIGRLLGPALIILLGALIGLLMAGLLSGITQLGTMS